MKLLTYSSLTILLALTACQGLSKKERQFLNSFIGKPAIDVIRAFGVPNRKFVIDNHTFLAYIHNETDYSMPMSGWGWGWGGYGWGPGWGWGGWGMPAMAYSYTCQTTFEFVNGVVIHWTRRGNGC